MEISMLASTRHLSIRTTGGTTKFVCTSSMTNGDVRCHQRDLQTVYELLIDRVLMSKIASSGGILD